MNSFADSFSEVSELGGFFGETATWIHGATSTEITVLVRRESRGLDDDNEHDRFTARGLVRVNLADLAHLVNDPQGHRGDHVKLQATVVGSSYLDTWLIGDRRDHADGTATFDISRKLREQRKATAG